MIAARVGPSRWLPILICPALDCAFGHAQTAAAVVVGQPKIDVAGDLTRSSGVSEEEQAVSETEGGGTDLSEKIIELEALAAKYKEENGVDMIDELASGSYIDKHTKLYVPVSRSGGRLFPLTRGFRYRVLLGRAFASRPLR